MPLRQRIKPQQRRHWYRIEHDYCPLCGRSETHRERVYGRKPKRGAVRLTETWCGCSY